MEGFCACVCARAHVRVCVYVRACACMCPCARTRDTGMGGGPQRHNETGKGLSAQTVDPNRCGREGGKKERKGRVGL